MPSKLTPFKLTDTDRYLLAGIARMENTDGAGALRIALNEAAATRGIHPSFITWTDNDGYQFPVEVVVPQSTFEQRVYHDLIAAELQRWNNVQSSVANEPDANGWYYCFFQMATRVRGLSWGSIPIVEGQVCVIKREDRPEVYIRIPQQKLHPGYEDLTSTTNGLWHDELLAAASAEYMQEKPE